MRNSNLLAPVPLTESQPHKATNITIQLIFAQTNVPQKFPAVVIPPGLSAALMGTNGTGANAQQAYVADYPEKLTGAGRVVVSPSVSASAEVTYAADNLGTIWAMGTAGDGILASIRGVSVG
jgi:hypothetical protein